MKKVLVRLVLIIALIFMWGVAVNTPLQAQDVSMSIVTGGPTGT